MGYGGAKLNQYNELVDRSSEEMLTTSDVARLLKVHPNSVRRWSNEGLIKVYRVGRRRDRRFKPDDVTKFLESGVDQPSDASKDCRSGCG